VSARALPLAHLECLQRLGRVKTQRATLVVIRTDIRQLAAAIAEKLITDVVIPLDGIQHPNWRLRVNNTVRQAADNQLVLLALFYRHVESSCCLLLLCGAGCRAVQGNIDLAGLWSGQVRYHPVQTRREYIPVGSRLPSLATDGLDWVVPDPARKPTCGSMFQLARTEPLGKRI